MAGQKSITGYGNSGSRLWTDRKLFGGGKEGEEPYVAYREQVKIINDDYVPIRSIELAKIGTHMVYNLVLATIDGSDIPADKAVFYAHGLAVGDNQMQFYAAKAAEQRLRETRGLDRIWKTDMETAANYFQIYNQEGILWKN